jgi:chromosome segregation ATPase
VTTDASLQLVTITKDGDHYNPAGSISGGSSSGFNGLLSQLQKLRATQNERLLLSEKLR